MSTNDENWTIYNIKFNVDVYALWLFRHLRCKNYIKCYLFGDDEIENFNGQASFSQAHKIGNILSLLPTFFS